MGGWISVMIEPVFLLTMIVAGGVPLLLLPRPIGFVVSVVAVGIVLWFNHRLEESVRRLPARVGVESMEGQRAEVLESLDPAGTVRCGGEVWRAVEAAGRRVGSGETVRVVRVNGLRLSVVRECGVRCAEDEVRP